VVIETATTRGLWVPADVSVTGYDDGDLAAQMGSTTIHQPLFESGVRAVERLLTMIDRQPSQPLREIQDIRLVVRRSKGAPRG
jgi:DNA-binding LacI/PurR family transcriptional regulator